MSSSRKFTLFDVVESEIHRSYLLTRNKQNVYQYSIRVILLTNIDQKLVNSLHRLLNCEIGGLDCRVITTEYRTRVHCIHMYHLFCNALVHVIYSVVSGQYLYILYLVLLNMWFKIIIFMKYSRQCSYLKRSGSPVTWSGYFKFTCLYTSWFLFYWSKLLNELA